MNSNKLFDDCAKIFGDTMGTLGGFKEDMENFWASKFTQYIDKLQLVTREEFNVVSAMLQESRIEQENLKKKVAELEEKIAKKKS